MRIKLLFNLKHYDNFLLNCEISQFFTNLDKIFIIGCWSTLSFIERVDNSFEIMGKSEREY